MNMIQEKDWTSEIKHQVMERSTKPRTQYARRVWVVKVSLSSNVVDLVEQYDQRMVWHC